MAWIKNNESTRNWELYVLYFSDEWLCSDNDYAQLIITYQTSMKFPNRLDEFEVSCFSGITSSYIKIDSCDFSYFTNLELKPEMTDEEMIFKIADYLCEKFCEKRI